MARVLAISSQVARGHVGLSAIVPALQRLGHEVTALPTILLSAHPGHPAFAGERVEPALLRRMLEALRPGRWADGYDAILSGYLPSAAHVDVVAELVGAARSEAPILYLCDPVLGDHPKGLYIERGAAEGVRDRLVPLADIVLPNLFELTWLTGGDSAPLPKNLEATCRLATSLERPAVIVTSAPATGAGQLENLICCRRASRGVGLATQGLQGSIALSAAVERIEGTPHGTGDLLSGLILGHVLAGRTLPDAMARAVAGLDAAVRVSAGGLDLRLVGLEAGWADAPPLALRPIVARE